MKDTHELVIKADTNDADYITQTTGFVDGQVHFELNEFFSGSPSLTMREFLAGLVNALKALHLECPSQHNWSNEYCLKKLQSALFLLYLVHSMKAFTIIKKKTQLKRLVKLFQNIFHMAIMAYIQLSQSTSNQSHLKKYCFNQGPQGPF